ncbi:MAG TPA: hypothetical protein PLB12_06935 [Candidatus Goldiibacteriota bacterium]|nr:hypothetical protein [Candidatus Goldiibacteriota bacterium]HPI02269.1 hypothetical protein [Candidatus Goldiibacteriota bacterium]HPN64010.1 hypothetical protein [Candidatus Goldiibacteriota bacterium]HRQ44069.1 hypothetical protein [Candidatus Goldiibacteriota bacterium]
MRLKILTIVSVFFTSLNFLMFALGIKAQAEAFAYLDRARVERALNSGFAVASNQFEDAGRLLVSGDFIINGCKVYYEAGPLDAVNAKIFVTASLKGKKITSEYLRKL